MYKRRKRAKYIWLPNQWSYDDGATLGTPINAIPEVVPVNANQAANISITPVLLDSTLEDTDVNNSTGGPTNITIADIVQANEYFVKRIVGNVWIALKQDDQSSIPAALIEAGLFVARTDGVNPEAPMGASTNAFSGYDPAHPDTTREPWIWKKSWILSNQSANSTSMYSWGGVTNFGIYDPGLRGGGNVVDQKTARRIKSDERLWFAISTRAWPQQSSSFSGTSLEIEYTREFRVLGQLRRARSSGNF